MQEEIAQLEVTGESGAGLVMRPSTVRITAAALKSIQACLEDDKEMLEDLVAAAFNDAARRIDETQKEKNGLLYPAVCNSPPGSDAVLMQTSPLLTQLMEALRCLPGVGSGSAQRMAFTLLQRPQRRDAPWRRL